MRGSRLPARAVNFILGRKPSLKEVIDEGAEVITQDQQDREKYNRKQNDDQRKFYKALTATVGR